MNGVPLNVVQRDYQRHDYFPPKPQDYPTKPQDYPSKLQEYPTKQQEYSSNKPNNQGPAVYKAQSREVVPVQRQQSPRLALSGNTGPPSSNNSGPIRERVASPHRVTSPPIKLQESQRLSSPPVKMVDQRPSHDYTKMDPAKIDGSSSPAGVVVGVPPISPTGNVSGHFIQQYPERDTTTATQGGPVWEGGYLLSPDKYTSSPVGPYSPLSIPTIPLHQSSHISRSHNSHDKAVDALDNKELSYSPNNISTKNNNNNQVSQGLDDICDEKYREYPAEKDDADPEVMVDGCDLKKLAEVTSKMALTVLPDEIDTYNELNKQHLNGHLGHLRSHLGHPTGHITPESTDCGSLSKSSSDGDHMINRKRPPTKLKSKRRNILSFPHHLSTDELRVIQVRIFIFLID